MDLQHIVKELVSAYRDSPVLREHDPRYKSIMELDRLAYEEPATAWNLILSILEVDRSTRVLEMLAAGPLEDLIEYHGSEFVDRIEQRALADSEFRRLLGGVWKSGTPAVWRRIAAVRGEGW
jgi:hypothetical protein